MVKSNPMMLPLFRRQMEKRKIPFSSFSIFSSLKRSFVTGYGAIGDAKCRSVIRRDAQCSRSDLNGTTSHYRQIYIVTRQMQSLRASRGS
jgi:hypothetical protein